MELKVVQNQPVKLEQYQLTDTKLYEILLDSLLLDDFNILEIGFGEGTLTRILCTRKIKSYVGIEIDQHLDPGFEEKQTLSHSVKLIYSDLRKVDYGFLKKGNWAIVANPPYSQLPFILEQIIEKYEVKNCLLMGSTSKKDNIFHQWKPLLHIDGKHFKPHNAATHLIYAKGFFPCGLSNKTRAIINILKHKIAHPEKGKKMGFNRRVVILLSKNQKKLPEFERNFSLYGIEVFRVSVPLNYSAIRSLLTIQIAGVKIVSVIKESSNLFSPHTGHLVDLEDLNLAHNISSMDVYSLDEYSALCHQHYTHTTKGYIDRKKAQYNNTDVFDWDDVFVVSALNKTYFELKESITKISSRDMNISKYIKDRIYYRKPVNLTFYPDKFSRAIDFSYLGIDHLKNHPYLANDAAKENGLYDFFECSAMDGIFFRAAENRRHKNYWWPGLNAGLPFTPKKDQIHEATYMAHDFIHFMIPDLIFTGEHSELHEKVYIIYRMMSEATTLVFSDMLFADSLKRSCGIEYDFKKRCFQPVYEACGLKIESKIDLIRHLQALLRANVSYTLLGDIGPFSNLVKQNRGDLTVLEKFQDKYLPFFVEDFRWTQKNYRQMQSKKIFFRDWWQIAKPINDHFYLKLQTLEGFIEEHRLTTDMTKRDLVDRIFTAIYFYYIQPILNRKSVDINLKRELILEKAFCRYMMGQFGLFAKFNTMDDSQLLCKRMTEFLADNRGNLTLEKIDRIRKLYGQFNDSLYQRNLISLDDCHTYKEVFPLFDPFYVFYDEKESFYEALDKVSEQILGP